MSREKDVTALIDYIKSSKSPVGKSDIIKATGFTGDFARQMNKLRDKNPELQIVGAGKARRYIWKDGEKKIPEAPASLYSADDVRRINWAAGSINKEMKNPEGYSDTTAGRAIANVMRTTASDGRYPMNQRFGEVWKLIERDPHARKDNFTNEFLVIAAKASYCIGYRVFSEKTTYMSEGYVFKWRDDNGMHYISLVNPINVYHRNLSKEGMYEIDSKKKEELRSLVSSVLDISTTIKEVQVPDPSAERTIKELQDKCDAFEISNSRLEKENDELKAKLDDCKTDSKEMVVISGLELALLKQKVEIYEKFLSGAFKTA